MLGGVGFVVFKRFVRLMSEIPGFPGWRLVLISHGLATWAKFNRRILLGRRTYLCFGSTKNNDFLNIAEADVMFVIIQHVHRQPAIWRA